MIHTETIIRQFPLVARPRPLCGPLAERVAKLRTQVDAARCDGDRVAASAVLNQAALGASDCGLPDVARAWCHRHASLYFAARPLAAAATRSGLEPLVNLARLHIRAGDGDTAFQLLDELYHAVETRTDTTIDGTTVPLATLVANDAGHDHARRWLWTVHLSDGTRALTTSGRWYEAYQHLRRRNGIGNRMLDGRQVAIIDHLVDGVKGASSRIGCSEVADPVGGARFVWGCCRGRVSATVRDIWPRWGVRVDDRCRCASGSSKLCPRAGVGEL